MPRLTFLFSRSIGKVKEAEAIEQQMRAKGGSVPPAGPGGPQVRHTCKNVHMHACTHARMHTRTRICICLTTLVHTLRLVFAVRRRCPAVWRPPGRRPSVRRPPGRPAVLLRPLQLLAADLQTLQVTISFLPPSNRRHFLCPDIFGSNAFCGPILVS